MTRWQSWDAARHEPGPWHVRTDVASGEKRIAWRLGSGVWGLGDHHLQDLVYGGELVARAHPDATIVLTEGERAADAVRDAGYVGAGTVCGASSTPGDAVLGLLHDRHVTLWPDADAVGAAHMARIAGCLERIGVRSLRLVSWADAREHDDAADAAALELIDPLVTGARLLPLLQRPVCADCGKAIA